MFRLNRSVNSASMTQQPRFQAHSGSSNPLNITNEFRCNCPDGLPDHLVGAAYSEIGVLQRAQGNTLQSVEAFRQAVNAHPKNGGYHMQLAAALLAAGVPADAPAEYREAARLLPDLETNPWLHLQLGRAYREAGRPREAIAAYERALQLDGNNPEALR